ncbi:hypothetical protein F4861DRAFT_337995 [Xylaria intraflava]|nr:hypothetical protein F4861DRAFT_337995 [Xylaria intraflava]
MVSSKGGLPGNVSGRSYRGLFGCPKRCASVAASAVAAHASVEGVKDGEPTRDVVARVEAGAVSNPKMHAAVEVALSVTFFVSSVAPPVLCLCCPLSFRVVSGCGCQCQNKMWPGQNAVACRSLGSVRGRTVARERVRWYSSDPGLLRRIRINKM